MLTGLRPTALTDDNDAFVKSMPTSLPAQPESWVDLLRRNGWHTASLGKVSHEPDGYQWNFPANYDLGRSSATFPDMRFSWNEVIYDHDKWGAQRYPLFAYADGTGRASGSWAYEAGVDGNGASLPDEAYPDGQLAQAAIEKLREFKDDNRRFCLAVGFFKPHLPFNAPKAYFDLYNPATLPAAFPLAAPTGANAGTSASSGEINSYPSGNSDRAKLRHAYFACVSYLDAQVGKVLAELDTLGLADNTIVVLWGDHGWRLDDYGTLGKHILLERALEAPLIIRPPATMRTEAFTGQPTAGIAETIDIYPTIAGLCGLAMPPGPVGTSLVPALRNPFAPGKSHAYSRYGSMTSVRTPGWRLINSAAGNDLYDLSAVRYEIADISASHPAVVSDLAAKLAEQGSRPGITYIDWTVGNPQLSDPNGDADHDGSPNLLEYGSGTDPLDPASAPAGTLTTADLTGIGFSERELVFQMVASTLPNDITIVPATSSDLRQWSFAPLRFLDATDVGGGRSLFRYRLPPPRDPVRFFRAGILPPPSNPINGNSNRE
jgi:arylsulfatase A-like enzyme